MKDRAKIKKDFDLHVFLQGSRDRSITGLRSAACKGTEGNRWPHAVGDRVGSKVSRKPHTRLTAALLSEKATMETAPGVMLAASGELAASGQISRVGTYAGIAGPPLDSVVKMQENGTLMPEMEILGLTPGQDLASKAPIPLVADPQQ